MEVHHHPDLHHKFLMIFLAITMGGAESLRERYTEKTTIGKINNYAEENFKNKFNIPLKVRK